MKKSLFSFMKRGAKNAPAEQTERKVATVNTEFAKGISLDESFEDMFPGERPDEVRFYDIHGNEVEQK